MSEEQRLRTALELAAIDLSRAAETWPGGAPEWLVGAAQESRAALGE